jgi:hypothetical protein
MARTSAFGFTNVTDGADITPKKLGLVSNYAVTSDTANEVGLNNKTAPIDVQEVISIRSRSIPAVNHNLNIQYPSPVKSGIQYTIQEEATLSTTDSADSSFRVDEPIVVTLGIRHPKSGNIDNAKVATVVMRALSACMRADGTWRFDDFMRSAERPVVD